MYESKVFCQTCFVVHVVFCCAYGIIGTIVEIIIVKNSDEKSISFTAECV